MQIASPPNLRYHSSGMNNNPENTKLDKLRMAIGTLLALAGVVAFIAAWTIGLSNLALTFAAILLIMSGIMIAGSHRLARLISDLLQ